MKIVLTIAILFLFAISCNNDQRSENKTETPTERAKHNHGEAADKLGLNNGAKWKADSSTNNNVKELQVIMDKFNSYPGKSINSYHSTAIELQGGLDKMISECKMKGSDHDALHKWLEPLISEIAKLKKAVNEQEGAATIKEIEEHLKSYTQYFES